MKLISLALLSAAFLQGCGYRFGHGELAEQYETVSVPYAVGDVDGTLTAEVVKRIATSGAFRYAPSNGELVLKIAVLDVVDTNIGYRYDRKRDGHLKNSIIPTESRLTAIAEVSVIDSSSGEAVRGPTLVRASLDFDFDYYKIHHAANVYSLGQLTDVDSAIDAARRPLDLLLAEKIVEYLINSW